VNDPLLGRIVAAIGHHYTIEHEIGRGGMSVVYRARDLRLVTLMPPGTSGALAARPRLAWSRAKR